VKWWTPVLRAVEVTHRKLIGREAFKPLYGAFVE